MEIIPAIDIKDGKCVRLYQGDYSQQTIFDTDPVSVALKWRSAGARWLHIIDLDGAATGKPKNISVIKQIIKQADCWLKWEVASESKVSWSNYCMQA